MAVITPTPYVANYPGGQGTSAIGVVGPLTATGASDDYVDTLGFAGRLYVAVSNGATTTATFTVQGSADGTNWITVATRTGANASYVVTGVSVAGDAGTAVFMAPTDVPRYVRVNQSAANSNGTTYTFYMEK